MKDLKRSKVIFIYYLYYNILNWLIISTLEKELKSRNSSNIKSNTLPKYFRSIKSNINKEIFDSDYILAKSNYSIKPLSKASSDSFPYYGQTVIIFIYFL